MTAPLNRNHPLARGLELWWLALPHLAKGYTWRDIAGRNDGTLTSMDLSTTTRGWLMNPHSTGQHAMRFDYNGGAGPSSKVITSTVVPCISGGSTAFTLSGWGRGTSGTPRIVIGACDDSGFGPFLFFDAGTVYASAGNVRFGSASVTNDTLWHHYQMVFDGSQATDATRLKAYRDGVQLTLSYNNTVLSPLTGGTHFCTGVCVTFGYSSTGDSDDIKVHSRPLPEHELQLNYRESLAGHPNLLRYHSPNRRLSSGNRRRRLICCGGF